MFKSEKNDRVTIAYPHPNEVAHSWTESMIKMISYDYSHKARISQGGLLFAYSDSGGIIKSRNFITSQFLKSDCDWLFWIDTDMGFEEDSLERLIEISDPEERPIVGGLCFGQKVSSSDGFGGQRRIIFPTILMLGRDYDDSYTTNPALIYPVNQLVECDATGSAFLLVHRSVYESIGDDGWYNELLYKNNNKPFGEDISFCIRAKELGYPIHVHTGIKTTHLKERWISDIDHWNEIKPGSFDINVDVITACRTAEDFIAATSLSKSIKSTTGYAKLKVVVTENDPVSDFWVEDLISKDKDISVIKVKSNHYPQMIQDSLNRINTFWFVITKPHVTFKHGWLDHAFTVAETNKHGFIGLNDESQACCENFYSPAILINKNFISTGEDLLITKVKHFWLDALVLKLKSTKKWSLALNAKVNNTDPYLEVSDDIIQHDYGIIKSLTG